LILALECAPLWRAQAAAAGPVQSPPGAPATQPHGAEASAEADEEEREGEAEEEEEEEEAGEGAAGDEEEEEGSSEGGESRRCGLLRVEGEAVASADRLRLTLRYSTVEGGEATVDYSARGPHGELDPGPAHRALRRAGTLELSRRLSAAEARRVQSARSFLVRVELAGDAPGCSVTDRLLLSSRGGDGPRSWSERHRR
jgi:hypothetical protein